jgi:hypothetical protein
LLAAPLTVVLGPVPTYNILCILAPALAAWSAFMLCREITKNYIAALAGGCVFGFSAYTLAEIRGHLPLVLVFPVPLALLLVVKQLDNRIGVARFSLLLGIALTTAFLCWAELYATMTLFGAIALGLTLYYGEYDLRERIRRLILPLAVAYAISLIVVLPYLYYFFQAGYPYSPINSPNAYSADLLNLIIPTPINALGNIALIRSAARSFSRNSLEATAYFGLPLIAITVWLAVERSHETVMKVAVTFAVIVAMMMCGPRLHVLGNELFGMPWKIALHLPLLHDALPVRFSLYLSLVFAIIVSIWLSARRSAGLQLNAIVLLAISLCPNLDSGFWRQVNDPPEFFANGYYNRYLKRGENVVILPYGITGASMLWQAESNFYFRMAEGWTSITPREFQSWPIVNAMLTRTYIPDATLQLRAFMAAHDVRKIMVTNNEIGFWEPTLAPFEDPPVRTGGVVIYSAASHKLAEYGGNSALEMERHNNLARFSSLLLAANSFLAQDPEISDLTPLRAQDMGLLPPNWVTDPDVRTNNGLYLGPWGMNEVAVGVVGSYQGLQPVIAGYRAAAGQILFPFPRKLIQPPQGNTFMRLLVMTFDRRALSRAARIANSLQVIFPANCRGFFPANRRTFPRSMEELSLGCRNPSESLR